MIISSILAPSNFCAVENFNCDLYMYVCHLFQALPFDATVDVGQVPPLEVVAVVRPASYDASSTSNSLDQKYIFKDTTEMSMVVTFRRAAKGCGSADHIYSKRVAPSCHKGLNGLYIFPLGQKFPKLFRRPGVYRFLFSLVSNIL